MKLKVGDVIRNDRWRGVYYEIVDIRPTGYGWKYPEHGDRCPNGQENLFISENSSDPFFELGWELRKMRDARRDGLVGMPDDRDRLWILKKDGTEHAIVEYNSEITGYSPALGVEYPTIFHYGGNAWYITGKWAEDNGYTVEEVEDRR